MVTVTLGSFASQVLAMNAETVVLTSFHECKWNQLLKPCQKPVPPDELLCCWAVGSAVLGMLVLPRQKSYPVFF